jgi:hypothetical protein
LLDIRTAAGGFVPDLGDGSQHSNTQTLAGLGGHGDEDHAEDAQEREEGEHVSTSKRRVPTDQAIHAQIPESIQLDGRQRFQVWAELTRFVT